MSSDTNISQGSVAMPLRMCNDLANFPMSVTVKKNFENRPIFGEVMDKSLLSCFLTHGVDWKSVTVTSHLVDEF